MANRNERSQPAGADQSLAECCKALGHPIRVQIFRLLAARRSYCGDLVLQFGLAQSTISHHLKALRDVGLISGHEEGPSTCYAINEQRYEEFKALLGDLLP